MNGPSLADFAYPGGGAALHDYIVARMAEGAARGNLSSAQDFVERSRQHLAAQVDGIVEGGVIVSASGVHLVLAYVDHLERLVAASLPAGCA